MSKKLTILIVGLTASGKSSFAYWLRDKLQTDFPNVNVAVTDDWSAGHGSEILSAIDFNIDTETDVDLMTIQRNRNAISSRGSFK